MNAYKLADLIELCGDGGYNQDAATMLRQQKNEIEDLKNANRFIQNFAEEQHQRAVALEMGFANSGTHDSELAETRAMAGRLFLEIQALKQIIDANNLNQNIGQFRKAQEK